MSTSVSLYRTAAKPTDSNGVSMTILVDGYPSSMSGSGSVETFRALHERIGAFLQELDEAELAARPPADEEE